MKTFDIYERTFNFSVDVINLINSLPKKNATSAISNQLIRSACSVGANLREAKQGRTKKEFISSFGIALRECEETNYWLNLVKATILDDKACNLMICECQEITKIITTIIIKSKK